MNSSPSSLNTLIEKNAVLLPKKLKETFLSFLPNLTESQSQKVFKLFSTFQEEFKKLDDTNKEESQKYLKQKIQIIRQVLKKEGNTIRKYTEHAHTKQSREDAEALLKELDNL